MKTDILIKKQDKFREITRYLDIGEHRLVNSCLKC
jgi:hypothetical protein